MPDRTHVRQLLEFTRQILNGLIADFPADKLTYRSCPTDNHVLWVVGHLASTDAWIASVVGAPGTTMPEGSETLFGQGSKPQSDAGAYPSLAALRAALDANRAAILKWFESAPESAFNVNLKEKTGGFANDPLDLMLKGAWHEGWHSGQVANVRKALNLKSVIG